MTSEHLREVEVKRRHTASVTDGTAKKMKIINDSARRLLRAYARNAENTTSRGLALKPV